MHDFGWHFNVLKAFRNWHFDSLPKCFGISLECSPKYPTINSDIFDKAIQKWIYINSFSLCMS